MTSPAAIRIPRRARLMPYAVAAAALAVEATTHLVDFGVYDLRIRLLDSADEWRYSHLRATLTFAIGPAAGFVGARSPARPRRTWVGIGALFAILLADNLTRLHTHLPAWPLFYAPILLTLSVCIITLARGTDLAAVARIGLAALAGSLAIHVLGPGFLRLLGWGPQTWAYEIKVALKEGSELAGWVLLVPCVLRLACRAQVAEPC
jgi:hypothetical protein